MNERTPPLPRPSPEELLAIERLYQEAEAQSAARGRAPRPERPLCTEARDLVDDLVFLLAQSRDPDFAAARLRAAYAEIAERLLTGAPELHDRRL